MFYEYKAIYNKIIEKRLLPSSDPLKTNQLAFMIFIDGVSEDFIPDFPGINQKHLKDFRDELLALQEKSEKNEEQIKGSGVKYIRDYKGRCIKYFDGHRLRLLHYFNYIQLIIKHIEQADNRFSGENLAMVDYLCSEMSEHELGLLYSYYHYRIPNERYRPYYQAIFNKISNNRRFLFDNKLFIM